MVGKVKGINIISDFNDYYDYLSSPTGIKYQRNIKDNESRGKELKIIREMGLNTLKIKPVNQFTYLDEQIVVYTDSNKHWGHGKKVCTYDEAIAMYNNFPATKYYNFEKTKGITIKQLQIGKRRFKMVFQKKETDDIFSLGKLISIDELSPDINRQIRLPIFSIDFIPIDNQLIATDFNRTQQLSYLGIGSMISAEEVIRQIEISMKEYNILI